MRLGLPSRAQVMRYAAPTAFLLAATIAVLLIHNALNRSSGSSGATTGVVTTVATTRTTPVARTTTAGTTTGEAAKRFYVIAAGDTLNSIAAKFNTSVAKLYELNPGINANSLTVGQRLRVQ